MDSMLIFSVLKYLPCTVKYIYIYQLINKTEVLGNKRSCSKAFINEVSKSFLFERFSCNTVKRLTSK